MEIVGILAVICVASYCYLGHREHVALENERKRADSWQKNTRTNLRRWTM